MKKIFTILTVVLLVITVYSQNTSYNNLDINEHFVRINSSGNFFWGPGNAQTHIPKDSMTACLFVHNLWMTTRDDYNLLSTAAATYRSGGNDFWTGPIADNYDSIYDAKYDTVWKVNKSDIDYHIANYSTGGYVVSSSIASWPGNGNTGNGEAANLAPYIDANSNNTYDPENGDYPFIKGDQALFMIMNDVREEHTESDGHQIGIEVHVMVYGFTGNNNCMDSTFFISYRVFNRSVKNYNNVYIGTFTDADIGDASADYIGCDTSKNVIFTYNGTALDGDGTLNTYGVSPPSIGELYLNKPIDHFMYFTNGGGPIIGDPSVDIDFENFASSRWKDNSHLTYGGNGVGGTNETDYMFSGDIHDTTTWIDGYGGAGDRRGISTFEMNSFVVNQNTCFDIAFVYGRGTGDNISSVDVMLNNVDFVQNYYDTHDLDCNYWPVSVVNVNNESIINIYPNPSHGSFTVEGEFIENITVYNVNGQVVKEIKNTELDKMLNITNLDSGFYILKVETKNGVVNKKISVN